MRWYLLSASFWQRKFVVCLWGSLFITVLRIEGILIIANERRGWWMIWVLYKHCYLILRDEKKYHWLKVFVVVNLFWQSTENEPFHYSSIKKPLTKLTKIFKLFTDEVGSIVYLGGALLGSLWTSVLLQNLIYLAETQRYDMKSLQLHVFTWY